MNIKKKLENLNITMKLMLSYMVTIVTCMIITSVFYYFKTSNYMGTSTLKLLTQGLVQAKNNIDYKVDLYNSFEDTLYLNNNFQELLYSKNNDILEKKRAQDNIINYLLYTSGSYTDLSKITLYVDNYTIPSDDNYIAYIDSISDEKWYKTIIDNDDSIRWISNKSKTIPTEEEFSLVRPLRYMPSDDIVGILKIDLKTDKFFNQLKKTTAGQSGWFDVVGTSGNLIYSSLDSSNSKIGDGVFSKYKSKLYTNTEKRLSIALEGKKYITIFDTINYTGWKIIYITPESEFYSDIRNFQIIVIIVFFICTTIFLLLAWFVAIKSTRKIRILSESMKQIEKGNFDAYIHSKGNDEVDKLIEGFNAMAKNLKLLIEEVFTSKIKEKELELNALQAQIKPHFLYNTLSSISWLGMEVGSDEITKISNSLAKFYKYSLNKGNNVFRVRDEIELTKSYLSIQSMRFKNKINITYDINDEVLDLCTIKFIVQPFIENSIIHGMWGDKKNINIKLIVKIEDNKIKWKIIDDGIGMSKEMIANILNDDDKVVSAGYGIGNVDKRIKIYFDNSFGVKVYSRRCVGTTIIISTGINGFK